MKNKIALISGITGQDGSLLAKFLLKKKYIVHGIKRRSSILNTQRIDDIYKDKHAKNVRLFLHYGDVTDPNNVCELVQKIKPDEIYNLAAQSHVKVSFESPNYTTNTNGIGTLNFLEAIRILGLKKTRFYQASTSEMYGNSIKKTLNEKSPFHPVSPYGSSKLFSYWITKNYRESYNIFASNGILFNHESPVRGETFVTRKITMNVAKRFLGGKEILYLGNLYAKRDWGHAEDFVEGMWKILQYKKPEDFVLATNKTISVKDFVNKAFSIIGIKLIWKNKGSTEYAFCQKTKLTCVKVDPNYFRPNELDHLKGNSMKAKKLLNWKPKKNLDYLVKDMVKNDIQILKKLK